MECLSVLLHLSLPMTTFLSLSHSLGRFKLPFCIEMSFLFSHFSHFWPFQYSPFETCPFPHSMLLHCCLSFTFHLVLPTYIPTHNYTSLSLSLSLSLYLCLCLTLSISPSSALFTDLKVDLVTILSPSSEGGENVSLTIWRNPRCENEKSRPNICNAKMDGGWNSALFLYFYQWQ